VVGAGPAVRPLGRSEALGRAGDRLGEGGSMRSKVWFTCLVLVMFGSAVLAQPQTR